jgi:diguanylate cyclase (GGDEF)-like protein/PAS domain S-box-containing protein
MILSETNAKEEMSRELFIKLNDSGIIEYVTSNSTSILGYNPDEMLGKNIRDFIIKGNNDNLPFEGNHGNIEVICIHQNGSIRYLDTKYKKHNNGMFMSMIDITIYKELEEKNKRILSILENANDIIYHMEIKPEIKFTYLSSAIEEQLGYEPYMSYKNPNMPFILVHPEDYQKLVDKITGKADYSKPIVTRFRHKNGNYIWFEDHVIPYYDNMGNLFAIDGVCRNIQERKELEDKLRMLSFTDYLTGLFNRTYFENELDKLNNIDIPVGVIICDLDNLKDVNDSLGHIEGDELLKQTAQLIKESIDENVMSARVGGDEFAILIKEVSEQEAINYYKRINERIENYNKQHPKVPVLVSTGFAYSASSSGVVRKLYKEADDNMYLNKSKRKRIS